MPQFLALYGALFAAFGAASPFLPRLLESRGLDANAIALVLGLGSVVRLASGPLGGRLADRPGVARLVLSGGLAAAAVIALGYAPAQGFWLLALVSMAHAAVLAPLTPVADAVSLAASGPGRFQYGWLRGAGSAAFILGNVAAGWAVDWAGLGVIVWLNAGFLALAALAATQTPNVRRDGARAVAHGLAAFQELLRIPLFARLMLVAALVIGSHALHDTFEVIRWQAAGMSGQAEGFLWAESVAAEVVVFFFAGPLLIDRLGTAGAAMLSAAAGVVRWATASQTAAVAAMAVVEPLHGLTFALLHLVCMRVIGRTVPAHLAATAQAFYGAVAVGAVSAALTFGCGPLYHQLGAAGFWAMAALCAAALPIARGLGGQRLVAAQGGATLG